MTYEFLQQYWWFVIALLAGLLVFLLFVQGANSLIFSLGRTETERQLVVNSTGRKWEFTFTTLVTFGGAFFASFPLFYSTSFGGAYWVWMLILVTFVLQAVSYEFQSKPGHVFSRNVYRRFLVINGVFGPLLVGIAVGTFFNGANFVVNKAAMGTGVQPVISQWTSPWHGLEAVTDAWNLVLGIAVLFLARVLGALYLIHNVRHDELQLRLHYQLKADFWPFLIAFVPFLIRLMVQPGFAVTAQGIVQPEPYKYLHNLLAMPAVGVVLAAGVVLVLAGVVLTLRNRRFMRGIWLSGTGTVLTVLALFLLAGYCHTSYYPSLTDWQSSLTLANSSSSYYTLRVMTYVSWVIPFVLAYIFYAWRAIDRRPLTTDELEETEHKY